MSKASAKKITANEDAPATIITATASAKIVSREKNAIDEDAQRGDARPKFHGFIQRSDKTNAAPAADFGTKNLNARDINGPQHHREHSHAKTERRRDQCTKIRLCIQRCARCGTG